MFGSLCGIIEENDDSTIILNISGVGYLVNIRPSLIHNLIGSEVKLFIKTIVREDDISLYGFLNKEEKSWFNLLITVKGVGAKLAVNIIDNLAFNEFLQAVMLSDYKILSTINGIGKRIAERMIVELKDKIANLPVYTNYNIHKDLSTKNRPEIEDAISALITLGYSKLEVHEVIAKITSINDNLTTQEIIRTSLKEFAN